jgi:hypothetical protein
MHKCPGPRCEKQMDDGYLMCPAHWYQVPKALRNAVWRAYNRGAGLGTDALAAAQRAAIRSLERRP